MATTAQINKWLGAAVGRAMNPDGAYNLQCKDVIDDYSTALYGNWVNTIGAEDAKDAFNRANPQYFDKLPANADMQRGDIPVWGASWGGGFGHIAVADNASPQGDFVVVEQNGFTPTRPAYLQRYHNRNGMIGILRPKVTGGSNVDATKIASIRQDQLRDIGKEVSVFNGDEHVDQIISNIRTLQAYYGGRDERAKQIADLQARVAELEKGGAVISDATAIAYLQKRLGLK